MAAPSVPVTLDVTDDCLPLLFDASSPIVTSLPFLGWLPLPPGPPPPPPAGVPPPPPPRRRLPHHVAIHAFGAGLELDLGLPTQWDDISLFDFALSGAAWTVYLSALVDAGLLAGPLASFEELSVALAAAICALPPPAAGLPSPRAVIPGLLNLTPEAFDQAPAPAVVAAAGRGRGRGAAAVVGVPLIPGALGPPGLRFISLTSVESLIDSADATLPLRRLASLSRLLGPSYSRAVRGRPRSLVALGAEAIAEGIRKMLPGAGAPSDARLASALPSFLDRIVSHFPACYHITTSTASEILADLELRVNFCFGNAHDKARVELERIYDASQSAPTLRKLHDLEHSPASRLAGTRRAISELLPDRSTEPLHLVLVTLEDKLALRDFYITHELARHPHSSMNEILSKIVNALQAVAQTSSGASSGGAGPSAGGSSAAMEPAFGSARTLAPRALEASTNDADFQRVYRDVQKLDLTKLDDQLEALALAFESKSVLLHRYLSLAEPWLEGRHDLFSLLKPLLFLRGKYFGKGQTVRADGTIPRLAKHHAWGEAEERARDEQLKGRKAIRFTEARSQLEIFLSGNFTVVDWVNSPGGYLEIKALLDDNSAEWLDPKHHFCTVSCLEGQRDFGSATFVTWGYPKHSRHGYTWYSLLDHYVSYAKAGDTLVGNRREAHNQLARDSLAKDFKYAQELHLGILRHPNPATVRFDYLVPFDTPGVSDLKERLSVTEDVAILQRAMGLERGDRRPLRVEGVYESGLPQPKRASTPIPLPDDYRGRERDRGRDRDRRGDDRDRDRRRDEHERRSPSSERRVGSDDSRERNRSDSRDRDRSPLPFAGGGSRSDLVEWSAGGSKFALGRSDGQRKLYNAADMAKHYGVPVESKCWPSLLSTKTGDARFTLCPRWGKTGHESCDSAAHQPPPKFDAEHARAQFGRDLDARRKLPRSPTRDSTRDSTPPRRSRSRSPSAGRKPVGGASPAARK
jgi:hypothetical protein